MSDQEKPRFEVIVEAQWRIILTPERIEAIKEGIDVLEQWEDDHGSAAYRKSVAVLKDMIDFPDAPKREA